MGTEEQLEHSKLHAAIRSVPPEQLQRHGMP